jgi:hypothetical protein
MGKNYCRNLRGLYDVDESPTKRLSVANENDAMGENLLAALVDLRRHSSSSVALEAWLAREELPIQKYIVVLMRAMLDIDPILGSTTQGVLVKVLKWCAAVRFKTAYEEMWDTVAVHFHAVLGRSWVLMKARGGGPRT